MMLSERQQESGMKVILAAVTGLMLTASALFPIATARQADASHIDRCAVVTALESFLRDRAGGELSPRLQARFDALKARYC